MKHATIGVLGVSLLAGIAIWAQEKQARREPLTFALDWQAGFGAAAQFGGIVGDVRFSFHGLTFRCRRFSLVY